MPKLTSVHTEGKDARVQILFPRGTSKEAVLVDLGHCFATVDHETVYGSNDLEMERPPQLITVSGSFRFTEESGKSIQDSIKDFEVHGPQRISRAMKAFKGEVIEVEKEGPVRMIRFPKIRVGE